MEVIVAPEPMDYEIRGMYRFATLREDSGLAEAVRGRWPENPRLLMIAAEPDNDTYTENLAMDLATALVKVDLPVGELRVLQRETADVAAQLIAGADVIVLADGEGDDADAQREAFFAELGVPALLVDLKEGALDDFVPLWHWPGNCRPDASSWPLRSSTIDAQTPASTP